MAMFAVRNCKISLLPAFGMVIMLIMFGHIVTLFAYINYWLLDNAPGVIVGFGIPILCAGIEKGCYTIFLYFWSHLGSRRPGSIYGVVAGFSIAAGEAMRLNSILAGVARVGLKGSIGQIVSSAIVGMLSETSMRCGVIQSVIHVVKRSVFRLVRTVTKDRIVRTSVLKEPDKAHDLLFRLRFVFDYTPYLATLELPLMWWLGGYRDGEKHLLALSVLMINLLIGILTDFSVLLVQHWAYLQRHEQSKRQVETTTTTATTTTTTTTTPDQSSVPELMDSFRNLTSLTDSFRKLNLIPTIMDTFRKLNSEGGHKIIALPGVGPIESADEKRREREPSPTFSVCSAKFAAEELAVAVCCLAPLESILRQLVVLMAD
eukprot:TRINITY_DN11186_c0_g2_i1.p1 TRINITY_DN11186_c0_g2~~TRINITY_DN11186_c0_g2_i1.p1  ORF type:complete len:416 (-),score=26.50 TRINITY_DN11186_c0_g2_i1:99-1220(-)